MKNISLWKDTVIKKYYPRLDEDIDTDILIIGGGITGISTLYQLRNSNNSVVLVEQNKIGFGVTGNSTGKLNYLQNDLIDKIRNNFGDNKASLYLKSQIEAIKLAIDIIYKGKINCDLEKVDSYLYTNKSDEVKNIKNLEKFLNKNDVKTYKGSKEIVDSKYMIYVKDTYIFHPIKFIYGLLKENKFPIYENTGVKKIEKVSNGYLCYTSKNKIRAKKVVIASHYPFFNLPFLFPIKGMLEKSYLSASIYDGSPISLISYSTPFISMRNYNNYLVYLSNSQSLSSNVCDKKNFEQLCAKISNLNLTPDYLWSNIDIMTNDGLPYIGKLKDNMYIGSGYNTWGLASSVLAGKIIVDEINCKDNIYSELFDPNRININKCLGVFNDIYENINGYIKGIGFKNDDVDFKKIYNKKVMVYDNNMVYNKCPHLGCGLVLNEVENTWDCPCHGSRFDISGKCINGPANKNIDVKND